MKYGWEATEEHGNTRLVFFRVYSVFFRGYIDSDSLFRFRNGVILRF